MKARTVRRLIVYGELTGYRHRPVRRPNYITMAGARMDGTWRIFEFNHSGVC